VTTRNRDSLSSDRTRRFSEELNRKSLRQQIYEAIEHQIISCELLPGSRLAEELIAKEFGVSRSPVREALSDLERTGYLERSGSRDRRVIAISERYIADIYAVWTLLECERLYQVSLVASPEIVIRLDELLRLMSRTRNTSSLLPEFHGLLQQGCPNRHLEMICTDHRKFIVWLQNLYFEYPTSAERKALEDHKKIVERFKLKDREGLRAVVASHLAWQRDMVIASWRKRQAA
jgi:GntR family transcriptional regulator, rspAB operon transcriptional repressor